MAAIAIVVATALISLVYKCFLRRRAAKMLTMLQMLTIERAGMVKMFKIAETLRTPKKLKIVKHFKNNNFQKSQICMILLIH